MSVSFERRNDELMYSLLIATMKSSPIHWRRLNLHSMLPPNSPMPFGIQHTK